MAIMKPDSKSWTVGGGLFVLTFHDPDLLDAVMDEDFDDDDAEEYQGKYLELAVDGRQRNGNPVSISARVLEPDIAFYLMKGLESVLLDWIGADAPRVVTAQEYESLSKRQRKKA